MPDITIDLTVKDIGGFKQVTAISGDTIIQSTIRGDEITNLNQLAVWFLTQPGQDILPDPNLQRRLSVSYHIETVPDPEGGLTSQNIVIDNLQSALLPADQGQINLSNLPGWASWSASEAEQFIETNVTDLASAKTVLISMAKAVVYLRDIILA